jgi:class 3 adenylate cyclase
MSSRRWSPRIGKHEAATDHSPPVKQNGQDIGELLPRGTMTLLAADMEDPSRLREADADEVISTAALFDDAVCDIIAAHHGVRQVDGRDGFVAAFACASDALACAVELQRMPLLAPNPLRIALHTGEVQMRDDSNYVGPTLNRTASLRDLAHWGQTVLSGTTHDVAVDGSRPASG